MDPFLTLPDCLLYIAPIAEGPLTRREREKEAIRLLADGVFGPGSHIGHSPEGAPLHPDTEANVSISVSHSKSHCILAIATGPYINIGVDIESPRGQLLRVAPRVLTDSERLTIENMSDPPRRLDTMLRLWTAKEAVYKAALTPGLGLTEIAVSTDFVSAKARGRNFRLAYHPMPDGDLIAIATTGRLENR